MVSERGLTRCAGEGVIALIEALDRPATACQSEGGRASRQAAADNQCVAIILWRRLGKRATVATVKAKGHPSTGIDQFRLHAGICQTSQDRSGYRGRAIDPGQCGSPIRCQPG